MSRVSRWRVILSELLVIGEWSVVWSYDSDPTPTAVMLDTEFHRATVLFADEANDSMNDRPLRLQITELWEGVKDEV